MICEVKESKTAKLPFNQGLSTIKLLPQKVKYTKIMLVINDNNHEMMLQYLEYFNHIDWRRIVIVAQKRFKVDEYFWTIPTDEIAEYLSCQWMK